MRDPYTVLGLQKGASTADIKKAYRRLAKQYHPDQSSDPKAKDRFAEVGTAYEILGDDKKRGSFDRGEIDAEGKPKFAGGFEGFSTGARGAGGRGGASDFEFNFGGGRGNAAGAGFDASDIFADLFGAGAARGRSGGFGQQPPPPPRGEDMQATVSVTLAESVHGTTKRVTLPSGRSLDISIPASIEDGKQIRLKGQGHPGGRGASAGDALVTVHVARHPFFRVEGHDLRLDLPITFYEAVLGGKVNVPTLEGQVEMGVPAGANGARTMRLRGKGLPVAGGARGDLLVTLRIILPDDAAKSLGDVAQTMADSQPYDPRKAMLQ